MISFLDFAIFGGGRGLSQPHFSGCFYWLVDAYTRRGTFYTFIGGFGAQLQSFQWRHPRPGERRRLQGNEFVPFDSVRRWWRVRVSWAATPNVKDASDVVGLREALGSADVWMRRAAP